MCSRSRYAGDPAHLLPNELSANACTQELLRRAIWGRQTWALCHVHVFPWLCTHMHPPNNPEDVAVPGHGRGFPSTLHLLEPISEDSRWPDQMPCGKWWGLYTKPIKQPLNSAEAQHKEKSNIQPWILAKKGCTPLPLRSGSNSLIFVLFLSWSQEMSVMWKQLTPRKRCVWWGVWFNVYLLISAFKGIFFHGIFMI